MNGNPHEQARQRLRDEVAVYAAGRERILGGWCRVSVRDADALADRLAEVLGSRAAARRLLADALSALDRQRVVA